MSYKMGDTYVVESKEWYAPDGGSAFTFLSVVEEGYYSIGSNLESDIVLPAHAPAHLGIIVFSNGKTRLKVETKEKVVIDGQQLRQAELRHNGEGKKPTLVNIGTITFFVQNIGSLYAIYIQECAHPAI